MHHGNVFWVCFSRSVNGRIESCIIRHAFEVCNAILCVRLFTISYRISCTKHSPYIFLLQYFSTTTGPMTTILQAHPKLSALVPSCRKNHFSILGEKVPRMANWPVSTGSKAWDYLLKQNCSSRNRQLFSQFRLLSSQPSIGYWQVVRWEKVSHEILAADSHGRMWSLAGASLHHLISLAMLRLLTWGSVGSPVIQRL